MDKDIPTILKYLLLFKSIKGKHIRTFCLIVITNALSKLGHTKLIFHVTNPNTKKIYLS